MASSTRVVVVGVSGTQGSRSALAFAMHEAARCTSVLRVVTAWTAAEGDRFAGTEEESDGELPERARRHARHVQDLAVAQILKHVGARPILSRQVVEGEPGKVLVRVARDADCLVLGAASSSSSRPAPLGSVSDYCVRHATCAVKLVPRSAGIKQEPNTPNPRSTDRQPTTPLLS